MATGDRVDPYRGFNFRIEIGGIQRGGFREASGLDSSQDPIEYREGNFKELTAHKLPGLNKYSNISLKWGKTERKNGSIILINEAGEEKLRWNFNNGWPTKWTGPSFNATGNEVAIETLEIAHEGVEKA